MKSKIFPFLLLMFSFAIARAQNKIVSGKVTSDDGATLSGATISLKGTTTATTTDLSGEYSISVPSTGKEILIFSYVGNEKKEVSIGDQKIINVSLVKTSSSSLNEVVVIGYGTVKRKDLTGSVSSVSGKEIATAPVANVAQAMQGKLPGVSVVSQDGRPGADVSIRVRGGGSISQSNQPLILIDGVQGTLSDIPSDQVQSIDVLKDAAWTAI
jgi:outer membrane receptor protein involved in Fe transport